jgi:hypothetical protein
MAFTVETGTGLQTANAYITVQEFKDYHADRGNDLGGASSGDIEKSIVKASDYIDRRWRGKFVGIRLRPPNTQRMEWPRTNAFYLDGSNVLGVPIEIKEATAEYALRALSAELAPDPTYDDRNQRVQSKTERIGPISESTTYAAGGATFKFRKYPEADELLRELVRSGREIQRL